VKLAEDWIALSQIPFQSDASADVTLGSQGELWRANSWGRGTDQRRVSSDNPALKRFDGPRLP
jgi:hypothetical protein